MELNPSIMTYAEADFFMSRAIPKEKDTVKNGVKRNLSVTVLATPQETFRFWRNFKNLPRFMKGIADVELLSPKQSRWIVRMKTGPDVVWDAEIIAERP